MAVETENEEEVAPKKGGRLKLIIIISLIVLVLAGAGAGAAYFFGLFDSFLSGSDEEVAEEIDYGGYFLQMEEMLVWLRSDESGHRKFLKIRVNLELDSEDDIARVESVMPRVIDQFQTFLRELRIYELEGSKGAYLVREELLRRVNLASDPVIIRDILFEEFVIQ